MGFFLSLAHGRKNKVICQKPVLIWEKKALLHQGLPCCIWQLQNKDLSLEGTHTLNMFSEDRATLFSQIQIPQSRFTRTALI